MKPVGPDPGDFSLVPPPDLLGTRPPSVRRAAAFAGLLWWSAGLLGVGAAGLVVVDPLGGRPLASTLAFVGVGVFAAAVLASGLAALLTARWEARSEQDDVAPAAVRPELPAEALAEIEATDTASPAALPAPRTGAADRAARERAGR